MKRLLIVFVLASLTFSAMAQKGHFRGRGYYTVRPRVAIGIGGGFGYSPFYHPYYYPYGGFAYSARPSRLDLEIQDIQIDYADRIKSVRMDKSVPGKERRQRIRELKYQRDKAIVDAKRDYYYRRRNDR
jgi:hypothetical protein